MLFKETERISTKKYCPTRKVPLSKDEIFLREVQREDEINHATIEIVPIPKLDKVKVIKDSKWYLNFFKDLLITNAKELMP